MSEEPTQRISPQQLLKTRVLVEHPEAPLAAPRETGPLDVGLGAPWVVELQIHDTPLTVRVSVNRQIVIGRSDVRASIFPDLDLTPYDGLDKGVSRRHAAFIAEPDRLMLMDLGSTNGTFVNDQRLQAHRPYRLRHGDEVMIGRVRIDVTLVVVPTYETQTHEQPWVRMRPFAQSGNGERVLVVDDNPEVSATLENVLTRAGYEVQVVQEMAGAFYAVTCRMPDVIVFNLNECDINGLELCRYARRMMNDMYTPIILISSDTGNDQVGEIMNAGVDILLSKPLGVDELIRAINSVTQDHNVVSRGG